MDRPEPNCKVANALTLNNIGIEWYLNQIFRTWNSTVPLVNVLPSLTLQVLYFEAITFLVYKSAYVEQTLDKFSNHSIAFH